MRAYFALVLRERRQVGLVLLQSIHQGQQVVCGLVGAVVLAQFNAEFHRILPAVIRNQLGFGPS